MTDPTDSHHLNAGDTIAPHQLQALSGESVPIPDPAHLIHLELRRFAGCPVCNLHLRSVVVRNDELRAAGVREVVVFHSSADDLRKYQAELPFDVIPDPDKKLYAEFGVEAKPRAVLSPRAWPAIFRGLAAASARRSAARSTRHRSSPAAARPACPATS